MTNFKTPLRGQQELTLLGSEKTTSSLVVFILLFEISGRVGRAYGSSRACALLA